MDDKYFRARRIFGLLLVKMAFLVFFSWLPRKIMIRIFVSAEDTGELVIRLCESASYELEG